MSQVYVGILVSVVASLLPKLGVNIGNDALTTTITTLVTLGGAFWALLARYRMGGVTLAGIRKG